mgnify:CR=1 FL=1
MSLLDIQTKDYPHYRLHVVNTAKFKTISIIVYMQQLLNFQDTAKRALLPYVLQSATEKHPSVKAIRQYLEEMYGMTLSVDLMKKGDHHIITFRVDAAHESFLLSPSETNVFEKAIELISDVLLRPKGVQEKKFDKEIVRKEKRSLKQRIEAIYDDKMRYANMRLIEEMFPDDPFRQTVYGTIDAIDDIDEENLFHYYEKALLQDSIDIFVVGDVDINKLAPYIERHFVFPENRKEKRSQTFASNLLNSETKEIVEEQNIFQGKLNIGYRTNTVYRDEDYPALQVFNGIFGGFPHSKLFLNVREKESLAYYAYSRIESFKGLLIVMTGIDSGKFKRATEIIQKQMDKMKRGEFSQEELLQTKMMIKNQMLESLDEPRGITELLYNGILSNVSVSVDDWLKKIEKVTYDDVLNIAEKITLDTVYFLKGKEDEEHE